MRNIFKKFPEILFVDGTYNVNKLGMPLYWLMVEDGFGTWTKYLLCSHSTRRCNAFTKNTSTVQRKSEQWNSLCVIIIEKDFMECKVLKGQMQLYCSANGMLLGQSSCAYAIAMWITEIVKNIAWSSGHWYIDVIRIDGDKNSLILQKEEFEKNLQITGMAVSWCGLITFERDQAVHFANTINIDLRVTCHNSIIILARNVFKMYSSLYARTAQSQGSHVTFTEEFTSRCTEDKICGVPEIQSICNQYAADLIVN